MKYMDPETGAELDCTPAEYIELMNLRKGQAPRTSKDEVLSRLTRKQNETLDLLVEHGRMSTYGLASTLGITDGAASGRVHALKKAGVKFKKTLSGIYELDGKY